MKPQSDNNKKILDKLHESVLFEYASESGMIHVLEEDLESFISSFLLQKLQEERESIAKDICILIDEIESRSETNTLEEWKQYKAIRNAIRDKYVFTSGEEHG